MSDAFCRQESVSVCIDIEVFEGGLGGHDSKAEVGLIWHGLGDTVKGKEC